MKKTFIGIFLLSSILGLLILFPFTANFFQKEASHVSVDIPDLKLPFLEHERSKNVLIYFGYVGCTAVCIPTLNDFTPQYQTIKTKFPDTSFYFVNLNSSQPAEWVDPFAKHFHQDFKGIYLSKEELSQIEHDFNLAVMQIDDTISHSSNLYLMVREDNAYRLKRIYISHPFALEQILKDLETYK